MIHGSIGGSCTVSCKICGQPTVCEQTKLCGLCWEVTTHLERFLNYPKGRKYVKNQLFPLRKTLVLQRKPKEELHNHKDLAEQIAEMVIKLNPNVFKEVWVSFFSGEIRWFTEKPSPYYVDNSYYFVKQNKRVIFIYQKKKNYA